MAVKDVKELTVYMKAYFTEFRSRENVKINTRSPGEIPNPNA